jgi:methionine-gamma-lyase
MTQINPRHGLSTLVNHVAEGDNPLNAQVTPIYETSTFSFPDATTGAAIFKGEQPGYIYTRMGNPNLEQLAAKITALEAVDLMRTNPDKPLEETASGLVFASGMAAITAALLARLKSGDTLIVQEALYGATYNLIKDFATRFNFQVIWLNDLSAESWQATFRQHPQARLAYIESPANPTLAIVDLEAVAHIAHQHRAWLMVDNTFATPYCQRPFNLGADVIVHSTTKYLSGHGLIIGGAVISTHVDYVRKELYAMLKNLGGSASPFDAWLTNIGLKTFELRMQRHCENATALARWLEQHPKVERVFYPGLESHPGHATAQKQMLTYGGMLSFELKGGMAAGISLMDHVRLASLAPTLGNLETLVQHPASMSHAGVAAEARARMGISDGLVRLSAGIENIEDIITDLEQALIY